MIIHPIIAQVGPGAIPHVFNLLFVICLFALPIMILIYFVKSDKRKTELLKSISHDLQEIKDKLK